MQLLLRRAAKKAVFAFQAGEEHMRRIPILNFTQTNSPCLFIYLSQKKEIHEYTANMHFFFPMKRYHLCILLIHLETMSIALLLYYRRHKHPIRATFHWKTCSKREKKEYPYVYPKNSAACSSWTKAMFWIQRSSHLYSFC